MCAYSCLVLWQYVQHRPILKRNMGWRYGVGVGLPDSNTSPGNTTLPYALPLIV